MRRTLKSTAKTGRVTVELSNSSGKFWDQLKSHGLTEENYIDYPQQAGELLINLVESWHYEVSIANEGNIDLSKSFYLLMQWDKSGEYQLYQLSLKLPNPTALTWQVIGKRLVGNDQHGRFFEWFGFSGGQLKYYPLVENAIWKSDVFRLEPLPPSELGYGFLRKVVEYFPELWQNVSE
jgi:hypothetical protein